MKVLVVDDAILFRRVMMDVLGTLPEVELVGQAQNGKLALQKIRELKPDLMTLDLDMPEMDGLSVLDALKGLPEKPAVIVVSASTLHGGRLTLQALQKGAFDFITKPDTNSPEESCATLKAELAPRIKALALRRGVKNILGGASGSSSLPATIASLNPAPITGPSSSMFGIGEVSKRMARLAAGTKPELVLIGVSTGGPNALASLMPALPGNLGATVLIVQHMPPIFTRSLAESLDGKCALRVREAADGDVLALNTAYIAPGGKQMRLGPGTNGAKVIRITDDPPENNCRPAVDYLFRSVANFFPGKSVGVILTGMGSDGTLGLKLLKRQGCHVIAQDESSCVVYGMPKAAVDAGVVDVVAPLDSIPGLIVAALKSGKA